MTKRERQPTEDVPSQETPAPVPISPWKAWLGPALLLLLTLAMFGDVLLASGTVLSSLGTDLSNQFIAWREFGFHQLRSGNLPLWNPYLFSGVPYLGGFQAAMFYPPNMLHLVLPSAVAFNVLIALHIFLSGLFMYFWALRRGLHQLSATMSGALLMFGGAQFLHIYAGHLPNLLSMAWVPLVFLAIDGFFASRELKWLLLGMGASAMQILAGHPQYVFYTGVAAGIYWCCRIVKAKGRMIITAGFAAIFVGAAALTAVQLLTGFDASAQTVRGQGVPFEFAAMFSFPPENMLTLVAPNFFGDMINVPYWGRYYLWEMSLFMSVTGLALAIFGAIRGDKRLRLFALPMTLVLLLLALGSHTPLFRVLYNYFPAFDRFRGSSKFIFQASVFLALLAGVGLDTLLKTHKKHVRLVLSVAGGALAALVASLALLSGTGDSPARWWRGLIHAISASGETYLPASSYASVQFVTQAAANAARGMAMAAGALVVLAGLIWALRHRRWAAYGIALLAIVEVFIFARASRVTFELADVMMPSVQQFFKEHPGDYRVLNLMNPNLAMLTGKGDLWGYDPGVSERYAQFMAFTQQQDPDQASQYLEFKEPNSLYRMLRLRYVLSPAGQQAQIVEMPGALERLVLLYDYTVVTGRDRIFAAMSDHFNPARTVILEGQPEPAPHIPAPADGGQARIVDDATDFLEIQADLPSPAILLITDGYSKGWRAQSLNGSVQSRYEVMPANYVLMAVPLAAGHHHFRLVYAPRAFKIGIWISLASLALFLSGVAFLRWRKKTLPSPRRSFQESARRT